MNQHAFRQVYGFKRTNHFSSNSIPNTSGNTSERGSPRVELSNPLERRKYTTSEISSNANTDHAQDSAGLPVVARVSVHTLREERAYHICRSLTKSVDPDGQHIVRPIDIVRLSAKQGDKSSAVVCIYENIGKNYLDEVIEYGPFWYRAQKVDGKYQSMQGDFVLQPIPLRSFLDFAVGATECLEILHHGERIVHGEIRGDAFHMSQETGRVKLINFGSGLRTFEHGLTSTGWSSLVKEVGAKNKLTYMSPEQTGRMPAEPDSRTDIYSLGILFWTLLTGQPAFEGETPMDIIQGVLGRRLPSVSNVRLDIPDVIGRIIQKMTAKIISERYHSASGLRHDLVEVRSLLGAGDSNALKRWRIATKDTSSFFILPDVMIGRTIEHDEIVKIIDKVSHKHMQGLKTDVYSLSSGSSLSEGRLAGLDGPFGLETMTASSDEGTSSYDTRSNSMNTIDGQVAGLGPTNSDHERSRPNSLTQTTSQEGRNQSSRSNSIAVKPWEKNASLSTDRKSTLSSKNGEKKIASNDSSDGAGSVATRNNASKYRRKGRCEVISISGAAGLGKSCLVQSVQVEARRRGYFASSKFDQAKRTPFGPVLRLLSSLFKQVFTEKNTETQFHQALKQYARPAWPLLHKALGLPEFLVGQAPNEKVQHSSQLSHGFNKSLRAEQGSRRDSNPGSSASSLYSLSMGAQSSQDFLRAGTSTKSDRLTNTFLEVLRVFTQHKFICFCLDDLQFADDESLNLITQIIAAKIRMVIIITYRPDDILPEKVERIVNPSGSDGNSLRPRFQGI